jgi:multiple sugar transport system permease protein
LAYGLLAPSLVGIVVCLVVPIIIVAWLSFHRWDLLGPISYVGWDNWSRLLSDPTLGNSLLVTAAFALIVIPVQTALGLLLAVLLHRGLPGSGLLRAIYVLPWVCAPLALGIVWRWILAPTSGALNALLGTSVAWLTEPALALPAVALVSIWSQVGYVTLFFLAGLAVIPPSVVEAARLDGASGPRLLWHITLPLLRPTLFFVLLTSTITAFQTFDTVYALTQGGPSSLKDGVALGRTDVIARRIYADAFVNFDLGRAATAALVLFAVLVVVSLAQQLYFRRRITYDLS